MLMTPNLQLPYIDVNAAQREVVHNEAIRGLDALVQLAVLDRDLSAPPGAPAEGARWIVAASPTGAWAGHADDIAAWQDGAWRFFAPRQGWLAYVLDEGALLAWDGGGWVDALAMLDALQNLTLLGIGTTADTANPFSAKLNNALWVARTVAEGGDGHLRCKLSKESTAKTVSLLMQTNFSGRAEVGLTGDDDFHFKVSPDGTTWHDGIVIDKDTGAVAFPNTTLAGGREILAGNRTYYVRTDGSDANNGLANTAAGAFLTIQKAIDTAVALDLGIYGVTIQIGNGTYTGANILKNYIGVGPITLSGDPATPSNVVISTTGANAITADGVTRLWVLDGLKLTTATSGSGISAVNHSYIQFKNLNFGTTVGSQIHTEAMSVVKATGNYAISGGSNCHIQSNFGSQVDIRSVTVTLTGTPAFSSSFVLCQLTSGIYAWNVTFSGSATGVRYSVNMNAWIQTFGGGANFFPGNSAGSTATGGQYN